MPAPLLAAGQPGGGQPTPTSQHLFTAGLACCAAAAVLAVLARWGSPSLRAAIYASASAVMWALVATFIKATTDTLTQFGVAGMFTHWPIYALAAGSVAALFLEQAALHVGPLRASQPFIVIIDPIVSIALSVWLFAEHFTSDAGVLAVAAVAFAVMCAGVVVLTQTAPATMKDESRYPQPASREAAGSMTRQAARVGRRGAENGLPPVRAGQAGDAASIGRPSAGAGGGGAAVVLDPLLIGIVIAPRSVAADGIPGGAALEARPQEGRGLRVRVADVAGHHGHGHGAGDRQ